MCPLMVKSKVKLDQHFPIGLFMVEQDRLMRCILSPGGGGDSHMKQLGMLVRNFEFNP